MLVAVCLFLLLCCCEEQLAGFPSFSFSRPGKETAVCHHMVFQQLDSQQLRKVNNKSGSPDSL